MLSVDGLKVNYGKIEALKGVSLSVEPGEIVTVIGANGAGKSTLLRTLSGLTLPVEGQIVYLNVRVEKRSAAYRVRRGLVLVPEGRSIFGRMSVYENLLIGLYARKDTSGYERDMEAVFSTFPILRQRRAMLARFLSGGEQQMLAIGRALMADPKLLMMDEPSLGLAPMIVREIFSIIERLRNGGATVLLVEQNAMQALKIADRAYVLELGEVAFFGSPAAVIASPKIRQAYLGISS